MKLTVIEQKDDYLTVDIAGVVSRFHYLWLRDHCPDSRTPNGQKLHETNLIDADVRPSSVQHSDDAMTIAWSDGAQSVYPVSFLARWNYDQKQTCVNDSVLWDRNIETEVVRYDFTSIRDDSNALRMWLHDVARFGFGLLSGVPTENKKIFDVVDLFGFVRETNYGKLFEVRTEENASNLAYTPKPLSVHTDNPYRDPCPSLQLLHCFVQAEQGGRTALSDGFYAADKLRQESPEAFNLLASQEVSFRFESEASVLESRDKIISLNSNDEIREIRINNRSIAPLNLPFETTIPFYEALSAFRAILESDRSQFRFVLQPGDLLLLDNQRVLHGRAGESIGERHLQGCYADRDGLLSTLKVLQRNNAPAYSPSP